MKKRLLLIGGIISMVLPAMADTDLTSYHLVNDGESATCSGPEGYTGFEDGSVTMSPLYIKNCAKGQYYDATSETPVAASNCTWDGTKCTDFAGNTVAGVTSEADCLAIVDYYSIDACADVQNGQYNTPGLPQVIDGYLKSTTANDCPVGYNDGSDGDRATEEDCYKYCGTEENPTTVASAELSKLHATSATYVRSTAHNNGEECVAQIAADGCVDGYELVDMSDSNSYEMDVCEIGHTDNDGKCASAIAPDGELAAGTFFTKSTVNHLEGAGTLSYDPETQECSATVSYLKFYDNVRTDSFTINLGKVPQASMCLRTVSTGDAFAEGFVKHYTDGVLTKGMICLAKTVNITWQDVENPGDAATCTYGGDLNFPDAPTKPNYTFKGWTVGKIGD